MSAVAPLDVLEGRAAKLDVAVSRVPAADVAAELETLAVEPVVGSPLDIEGATLPEVANADPTEAELRAAETGVTSAAFAVADYGSVVVTPTENREGSVSLFPPFHVAVVAESDVVGTMDEGFDRLVELFEAGQRDAVFVTGPSSTGDMGGLVRGVHGPAEMHVVVAEGV